MVKIKYKGEFRNNLTDILEEQPELEKAVNKTVAIFERNPDDTRLGVHALRKRMEGKWSMGIVGDEGGDLRIVFEWLGSNMVRFIMIGPHPMVYARKRMKAR